MKRQLVKIIFFNGACQNAFEWHVWYSLTQNCVYSTQNTEFNQSARRYNDFKMHLKTFFFWNFNTKSRANGEKRIVESDSAKKGLSEKYVFSDATNFLLPSVISSFRINVQKLCCIIYSNHKNTGPSPLGYF